MASEKILNRKKTTVDEISNKFKDSATVLILDYKNLNVADATELRKSLKSEGSELKIYKNTLTNLALQENGIDLKEELTGSNALVFSKDVLSSIKTVHNFIKSKNVLEMRLGLIEGEITSAEMLNKLALTPDKQTLLTMLATGMMSTVKDLAMSMDLYAKQIEEK